MGMLTAGWEAHKARVKARPSRQRRRVKRHSFLRVKRRRRRLERGDMSEEYQKNGSGSCWMKICGWEACTLQYLSRPY